jgi:hypothetical protein
MATPDTSARPVRKERPVIKIPRSRTEGYLEIASLAGLVIILAVAAVDPAGITWKSLILPGIAVLAYALIELAGLYPHRLGYIVDITTENAVQQYQSARELLSWVKAEVVWAILGIEAMLIVIRLAGGSYLIVIGLFALTWVVINGALLFYVLKIYKSLQRRL